ncbi:hypothetical protein CLV49_3283 [Labedella gwakjiensis]|uniref:Uncharacterized protein n=1 Tax=Labedella gwakjiensis TaxID=390269 RepID=A0A2P8H0B7_9MICO|nr:hypothetical protein [Labedella gwakjiensis]PSL39639.1 hypothetical protein CLV49_3283 [Labedella gwakjiensis]RUQ85972.1 hypothetical protein ELQ93_02845 [Labedella gwakjiensis]
MIQPQDVQYAEGKHVEIDVDGHAVHIRVLNDNTWLGQPLRESEWYVVSFGAHTGHISVGRDGVSYAYTASAELSDGLGREFDSFGEAIKFVVRQQGPTGR